MKWLGSYLAVHCLPHTVFSLCWQTHCLSTPGVLGCFLPFFSSLSLFPSRSFAFAPTIHFDQDMCKLKLSRRIGLTLFRNSNTSVGINVCYHAIFFIVFYTTRYFYSIRFDSSFVVAHPPIFVFGSITFSHLIRIKFFLFLLLSLCRTDGK